MRQVRHGRGLRVGVVVPLGQGDGGAAPLHGLMDWINSLEVFRFWFPHLPTKNPGLKPPNHQRSVSLNPCVPIETGTESFLLFPAGCETSTRTPRLQLARFCNHHVERPDAGRPFNKQPSRLWSHSIWARLPSICPKFRRRLLQTPPSRPSSEE